jgi:hypothetical protein
MSSLRAVFGVLLFIFASQSTAQELPYDQAVAKIPPIAAGKGRIYFLRGKFQAGAITPTLLINGKQSGRASSGDFFVIDKLPGEYLVEVETEAKNLIYVRLKAGETKYVMFDVLPGFFVARIQPRLIEELEAVRELQFGLIWKRDFPINDPSEVAVQIPTQGAGKAEITIPSTQEPSTQSGGVTEKLLDLKRLNDAGLISPEIYRERQRLILDGK